MVLRLVKIKMTLSNEVDLVTIVRALSSHVPSDAFDEVVIVHQDGLYQVTSSTVIVDGKTWKVRFDPVGSNMESGDVVIGYAQGNLESLKLDKKQEKRRNELDTP